jgi:hypothetical protein
MFEPAAASTSGGGAGTAGSAGRMGMYAGILEWRRRYNKRVEQVSVLKQQTTKLEQQLQKMKADPTRIFERRNMQEQLARQKAAIKRLESRVDEEAFVAAVTPLKNACMELRRQQRLIRHTNSSEYLVLERRIRALQAHFMCRFLPDKQTPEFFDDDACTTCGQPTCFSEVDSKLICNNGCASARDCLSVSQPCNEESERTSNFHEREKHFRNWIRQFRIGIEEPPNSVILSVKMALMKRPIKSVHEVRASPIKQILRELGYREYIDRSARIAARLNGTPVPEFTDDEIAVFTRRYSEMLLPFHALKEQTRCNVPNSHFLVRAVCIMESWTHFLPCFSYLKALEKTTQTDELWYKVCLARNWPYERTI